MQMGRRTRFVLACACVAGAIYCLLEFSGIVQAWSRLSQAKQESVLVARHIADAHNLVTRNRSVLSQALQAPGMRADQIAEIEANIQNVTLLWAHAVPLIRDPEEGWLASDVARHRMQYLQHGLLPAIQILREEQVTGAYEPLGSRALSLYEPLDKSLEKLERYEMARAERASAAATLQFQSALLDFGLMAALFLLFTVVLMALLPRQAD